MGRDGRDGNRISNPRFDLEITMDSSRKKPWPTPPPPPPPPPPHPPLQAGGNADELMEKSKAAKVKIQELEDKVWGEVWRVWREWRVWGEGGDVWRVAKIQELEDKVWG